MPSNDTRTLRNLQLKPGAAYAKRMLNARRPKIVAPSNFFPGATSTARPTINTGMHVVTPTEVSVESMFSEQKKPSAFNLDPRTLRLRKRQENAVKASEGQEVLAFPMNESQGGETPSGGRRMRKHRTRKHRMRKHRSRKHRK